MLALALLTAAAVAVVDLAPLWDFTDPAASERRLREALAKAEGDDVLVLQTQIARTHGLRQDFAKARALLADIEPKVKAAGAETKVRWELEMGRTFTSATHPPESQTSASKTIAREHFRRAIELAKDAKLDGLAIDGIHMMAFIDTAPEDQVRWARESLAIVEASSQPEAKRWEGSIRNNLAVALQGQGRLEEALVEFRAAAALREKGTDAAAARVARWMVANVLREMGRLDEALAIQLRLEKENDAAGKPDPYVFDELEAIYQAKGDTERARHYVERKRSPPR